MILRLPCSIYDSLHLVSTSVTVLDSIHDICAGVIQKTKDNSLEVMYKVSSSRRDDNEVFDLDE